MKKYLVLFLTLALVMMSLGTAASAEEAKEPVTFKLMTSVTSDFGDISSQWLMKKIQDKFNITIEVNQVSAEGFAEKKSLAFGSGQLPDFFYGQAISPSEQATYGEQGVLIALEGYFTEEAMPNFMAQMEKYPQAYNAMFYPDGHAYGIWGFDAEQAANSKYWVNIDWAEKYIGKIPETLDEFYDYCVAVRDNDANENGDPNDEYGFFGQYNSAYGGYYDGQPGLLTAFGYADRRLQVFDGVVKLVPTDDNYKEYVRFLNKLYTEGLMNKDYFTISEEERIATLATKVAGSFTDWAQWLYLSEPADWQQWQAIDPLTSEYNSEKIWSATDVSLTHALCITNKCENVDRLIELADWFFEDEGILSDGQGPALGEWEEYPEYGWEFIRDEDGYGEFVSHYPEDSYDTWNAWMHDVVSPWDWPKGVISEEYRNETPKYDMEEVNSNLNGNIAAHYKPYYTVAYPLTARYTAEESDELSLITTDLNSFIDQYFTKFVIGELDIDQNWDKYVDEAMAMGGARYVEIYQQVYDRWAK